MNKGTTLGLLALSAVVTVINVTLAAAPAPAPAPAPLPSAPPGAPSASAWRWNPFFGPQPSPADRATAIQWLRRASGEYRSGFVGRRPEMLIFDIAVAQAILGDADGFRETVDWIQPRAPVLPENSVVMFDFSIFAGAFAMVGDEARMRECVAALTPTHRESYVPALRLLALAGRDQEILSVMPHGGRIVHYPIYIQPAEIAWKAGHLDAHDRLLAAGEATIETEVQRRLTEENPRLPERFYAGYLAGHRYDVCRDFIDARMDAGQIDAARALIERLRGNQRVEQFALLARWHHERGDRTGYNAMLKEALAGLPEAISIAPPDCFDALCATEAAAGDLPAARRHLQVLRTAAKRAQETWNDSINDAENAIVVALFESNQDKLAYTELEMIKRKRNAQGRAGEFPRLVGSIASSLIGQRGYAGIGEFAQRYPLPDDLRQRVEAAATRPATRPAAPPTVADVERQLAGAKDAAQRVRHLREAASRLTGIFSLDSLQYGGSGRGP